MAETIDGSNEIIFGRCGSIAHDKLIENCVIRICEEHRLDVGIVHANMLHAVFFLIATGELMLLDTACHIVVGMGTYHQAILRFPIHRLRIYIIMFARILYQPPLILELLEVLGSLLIDTRIILGCAYWEIYLGLDDVVEAHLVVASLCPRLFTIEHIVRTALHFLHQFLWRADSFKWFYNCHDNIFNIED